MRIIVSNIRPKPGQEAAVEAIMASAIGEIHKLPGCEVYALHRGLGRRSRGHYVLLEKWADSASLKAYGESSVLIELHEKLEDLIESLEDFGIFEALPSGDPDKAAI
jgi:quinol monooxygenase YgiN